MLLPFPTATKQDNAEIPDLLAYRIETDLMVYDPVTGETEEILPGWEIGGFSLSAQNRLAFSSARSGTSQVYLLDYPYAENSPVPVLLSPSSNNYPISWSPDGRELLIHSKESGEGRLILWEDTGYRIIYYFHGQIDEVAWSLDNQLAFTEFLDSQDFPNGDYTEIYLWDGTGTVSVSQNPTDYDRYPAWSSDGQLAFLSNRNGEFAIYVWDGLSKSSGAPDITTYAEIASGLAQFYSYPAWTNTNSVAFWSDDGFHIWDGENLIIVTNVQNLNIGKPTWRADGYWAFTTIFSSDKSIYVLDSDNRTVLKTDGQGSVEWSSTGILAFCAPRETSDINRWELTIWKRGDVIQITKGYFIIAKWNNGEEVLCSDG